MQDTDILNAPLQHATLQESSAMPVAQAQEMPPQKAASVSKDVKPRGFLQLLASFFTRVVMRQSNAKTLQATSREPLSSSVAPPAFVLKNITASTLITPMGAYAGKPVEQANLRRAEQQFKAMDISKTTMN